MDAETEQFDVAIIGAGFGGLGAALSLAERGARVALFERLTYPGGCASTFLRRPYRFEAGATLFSGFGKGQLFRRWIERHEMDVHFQTMDPIVELRTGEFVLPIAADRERFIEHFCSLDGAPEQEIRSFFALQKKVADALWDLFDDPSLLPPFSPTSLLRHLRRSPRYLPLLSTMGRSVGELLQRRGLWAFRPLRTYLNAVCQITVQVEAARAEAPFALAAMDYYFRGTGHIHGGIGKLATAITDTLEALGSRVYFGDPARQLSPSARGWSITSRRRTIESKAVVANLLPRTLSELLHNVDQDLESLHSLNKRVETGWGAAMLYLGLDADKMANPAAFHLELVDDQNAPFQEGNHLFCSVSGASEDKRAPRGQRVATISTHVDMSRLVGAADFAQAAYIDAIHQRMRRTLALRAPGIDAARVSEMTASPRTFERFTGRPQGYVGGIPRLQGLHNYRQLGPVELFDGLYLVGDSVFPGQSTLAVSLGGVRTAEAIYRSLSGALAI